MSSDGIELHGVHKHYGTVRALDGVTVTVGRGLTGLLGPNGAGKTTLLRMAATVLAPDRGTLRILGEDPDGAVARHRIRRRLGYLPQEPGFYRSFTAAAFIDYVAILKEITDRQVRRTEVERVVAMVGLETQAGTKVRALSGGMRRRLALATALLGDPDLLLLDEPTAGLDPEQQLRFRALISQLANRPTVLLSTHQTADVVALCERVVVLSDGTIHFDGTPSELAATASGRVWIDQQQDARAALSWRTGDGSYRHIGDPPSGAQVTEATIDDAYLLMVRREAA
jgi:ABC-2 type transport system ATP-binding protein